MALMIYKPERRQVIDGVERVLSDHEQWFVANTTKDFHTRHGVIPKEQLKPGKLRIGNHDFVIAPALFVDAYKQIKRKAQLITRKDVGFIIGYAGLTKDSVVVESGAGSGGATALLAGLCKHVYSYEIEQESVELVRENLKELHLSNATVTHADFYNPELIEAHEADLVLLDLAEPWRALAAAHKTARLGGYIVAYTPSIPQASRFVEALSEQFLFERTVEIIDRDWKMKGDAVRPTSSPIGHTAFLTVVRKVL